MKKICHTRELKITPKSRVLLFMPHPDDEAVFASGFIQQVVGQGTAVRLVTMTAGEKSTLRHGLSPTQNLAKARRVELANAMAVLGLDDFSIAEFPDGGLENSLTPMKKHIQKELRAFEPSHVITLEPDGVYGHPDHIALSLAVTELVKFPTTLLYSTVKPGHIFTNARKMAKKEVIMPILPDYRLQLSPTEIRKKLQAVLAHKTQFRTHVSELPKLIIFLLNDMIGGEYFTLKKKD